VKNPTDAPGAAAYLVNVSAARLGGCGIGLRREHYAITLDIEAVPAK